MKILIDNFDLVASFILLAIFTAIACKWQWNLMNKDRHEIKEFEDVKIDSKLEDE